MRPLGEFSKALLQAAACGPGNVVTLAQRAQVSVPAARYTASRMVARGELGVVQHGRPAVLGVHAGGPPRRAPDCHELAAVMRCFADL